MQIPFPQFYRQYGIRRLTQLLSPRLTMVNILPRDTVVHYLTDEAHEVPEGNIEKENLDIDVSKPYFGKQVRTIYVDYRTDLAFREGHPVGLKTLFRPMVQDFHRQNRKFVYKPHLLELKTPSDIPLVINYNYLNKMNRYQVVPLTRYFKFYNNYRTLFKTITEINEKQLKNHFIFIDVPSELPSFSLLNMYVGTVSKTMLSIFNTNASLFMLQFWQWLSDDDRDKTIFADLKDSDLSQINFVFNGKDSRSLIINLGYLNSWIKGHEKLKEDKTSNQIQPRDIQKLYLRLMMTISSVIPETQVPEETETPVHTPDDDKDEQRDIEAERDEYLRENDVDDEDIIDPDEYNSAGAVTGAKSVGKTAPNVDSQALRKVTESDIEKSLVQSISFADRFKDIDKDLEILDTLTTKRLKDRGLHLDDKGEEIPLEKPIEDIPVEVLHNKVFAEENYEDSLRRQIDENVDYGLLSAVDYKRLQKDIENYKQSDDPYGSGKKTVEAMVVTPEMIQLDSQKTTMAVHEKLADKTMATSSLLSFDRDYIDKVSKADMLSMVNTLQKAGIVIRKHEIETEISAMGNYENHTLELKPIDGQPSTLRYRLPVVNEDGSFLANGNKYGMRKQRMD